MQPITSPEDTIQSEKKSLTFAWIELENLLITVQVFKASLSSIQLVEALDLDLDPSCSKDFLLTTERNLS
jgi:hypothetical protein